MPRRGRNGRFVKGGSGGGRRRSTRRRASRRSYAPRHSAPRRRSSYRRRSARRYTRNPAPITVYRRRSGGGGGGGAGAVSLNLKGAKTVGLHATAALAGYFLPSAVIRKVSDSMDPGNFLVLTPEKPWGSLAAHALLALLGGWAVKKATKSNAIAATFAGATMARPIAYLIKTKLDPNNDYGMAGDDDYGFGPGSGVGADFSDQVGVGADVHFS